MAERKPTWVIILLALITLIGGIYEANKADPTRVLLTEATIEAQRTQAVQTQAALPPPSFEPSMTSPTLTEETQSPLPTADMVIWEKAGSDWGRSCISSEIWQLYPNTLGLAVEHPENCYNLIAYGITANQGNLAFVRNNVREEEFRGVEIPIPDNVDIFFDLRVNHLENAEVWVGIMKNPTQIDGKYLRAKAGDNFNITNVINNFPKHGENYYEKTSPPIYHFQYVIEGNLWTVNYDGSPAPMFKDETLNFSPRYLLIGYRAYSKGDMTGSIDVRISNLKIEEK